MTEREPMTVEVFRSGLELFASPGSEDAIQEWLENELITGADFQRFVVNINMVMAGMAAELNTLLPGEYCFRPGEDDTSFIRIQMLAAAARNDTDLIFQLADILLGYPSAPLGQAIFHIVASFQAISETFIAVKGGGDA